VALKGGSICGAALIRVKEIMEEIMNYEFVGRIFYISIWTEGV
jgi:hypothetical protein